MYNRGDRVLWRMPGDATSVVRGVVLCEEITDECGDPRCLVLSSSREIWMRSAELTLDHSAAASAAALLEQVSALLTTIEQLVRSGELAEASAAATVLAWFLAEEAANDTQDDSSTTRQNSTANKSYQQLSWR